MHIIRMRAALWAIPVAVLSIFNLVAADLGPYVNDSSYAAGHYGHYPLESYITFRNDHVPRLHLVKHSPACDDGRFYIITPSVADWASPSGKDFCGITIFDTQGNLIWHKKAGLSVNRARFSHAKIQTYNGAQYLTYFVGDTGVIGHGAGVFHMLDSNYKLAHIVHAHGDVEADFHEFTITEQGTALFTAYGLRPANLTHWGESPDGQAWDGIFQEVDIETNELLFEWRAADHFTFQDMAVDSYSRKDMEATDGFDWYHINSIEKDPKGNYLISSRYASTVTYIDGRTGEILWNLGGRRNSFRDISAHANASISFFCQHMPRWADNYTAITLFDNQAYWGEKRNPSRALKIRLDTEAMTSELVTAWQHPLAQWAEYAGGVSVLEGSGNLLVGYGYQPVISEFTPNGTLVCDTNFASQGLDEVNLEKGGQDSGSHSYRVFKQAWTARPSEPPSTAIVDDLLFVSWNGATEVRSWSLQARLMSGGLIPVGRIQKDAFECSISLESIAGYRVRRYRLQALGATEQVLGTWLIDTSGNPITDGPPTHSPIFQDPLYLVFGLLFLAAFTRLAFSTRRVSGFYNTCLGESGGIVHRTLLRMDRMLPSSLVSRSGHNVPKYEPVRVAEMEQLGSEPGP